MKKKNMKKAVIFLNGEYNYSQNFVNTLIDENTDCYCADGGANYIFNYGKIPKLIVGDLDSIQPKVLSFFMERNVAIEKFPPEKDFTDFELIVQAIEKIEKENGKYEKIYILGGIGGRIDMTLNNLHLLEKYKNLVFLSWDKDKIEEIFYTESPIFIKKRKGSIFSIISLDETIQKLTLKGLKYEIENVDIERKNSRLVSNEIISDKCFVDFEKGKILICLINKKKGDDSMIFTNLKDEAQNKTLAKQIQDCIKYTNQNIDKIRSLESGVYELETGIKMHVNIYETGTEKGKIWETHLKNLDVQIMIDGEENIAFNNVRNMIVEKIEKEKDLIIYSGQALFNILLQKDDVLVLYPEDVHMPGLQVNKPLNVRKLVFKIPIEILG